MRRDNYNLIINALDDKALYREICKKIKDTDAISFKLMCSVPILSGLCIITLYLMGERLSVWIIIFTGLFGALITYFIFRWEKRNIQMNDTFKSFAEILEAKKIQMEHDVLHMDAVRAGPYSLLRSKEKPRLWRVLKQLQGWGKTEAETAIYGATLIFWLLLPLLILLNI